MKENVTQTYTKKFSLVEDDTEEKISRGEPVILQALQVNEVLDCGETLTAVRLELSEEINASAIRHDITFHTFGITGSRQISYVYVNNSGKPHDLQAYGKYVFLQLSSLSPVRSEYIDDVLFCEAESSRPKNDALTVFVNHDIPTVSGKVISATCKKLPSGGLAVTAADELRVDVDRFKYVFFEETAGTSLYYLLYIPEGYEEKKEGQEPLPLLMHFPSGDYRCIDYTGRYTGSLYRHSDATVWTKDEVQKRPPAFVVTIGADNYLGGQRGGFLEKAYVRIVQSLLQKYSIDGSRIYGFSIGGGATMMWDESLDHPDLFAAIMSCGLDQYFADFMKYRDMPETELQQTLEQSHNDMETILHNQPCWYFAALSENFEKVDPEHKGRGTGYRLLDLGREMQKRGNAMDIAYGERGELMWNGLLAGSEAAAEAEKQIPRAKETGAESLITLYLPNTILPSAHFSWSVAYKNPGVQDWLFAQRKAHPFR